MTDFERIGDAMIENGSISGIRCYFCEPTGREIPVSGKLSDGSEWSGTRSEYRRVDTNELGDLASFPPGAMWFAPWLDDVYKPQLDHVLVVKTPGGDWVIDAEANNCTMPNRPIEGKSNAYERFQEDHHCWIIEGDSPPKITVSKNGVTCKAGAGSILQGGIYHGFLRKGMLVDA